VPLVTDKHYFPPYDAVPLFVATPLQDSRNSSTRSPISPTKSQPKKLRHLNSEVDANQRDPAAVIRAFRASKSL